MKITKGVLKKKFTDLQCGFSTRIGTNRKQAVETLKQSDPVRTLLFGNNGILSIEQIGSSQERR